MEISSLPDQHNEGWNNNYERKELQEQGVGDIALEMNKLVHAQTEEVFRRDFESWIANPTFTTMGMVCSKLTSTSSSPRFDV
ncbi:hypothetical protein V6N12_036384 [Hibiscus sabdariffa]|uniref:Uncharacterized protein n=1 Tax=Hibiscus sabdariffa TaxID=183260 RepID=A0ABR2EUH8_9ROSI